MHKSMANRFGPGSLQAMGPAKDLVPRAERFSQDLGLRERGRPVPLELWLYVIFSGLVVAADFTLLLFGPRQLRSAVMSFGGWEASAAYLSGLPCVWLLLRKRDLRGRTGITWILLIYIVFGVVEWLVFGVAFPAPAGSGPFLAVHSYRLLWTVVVPTLWLLVMRSPRIRDYCTAPPRAEGAQPG